MNVIDKMTQMQFTYTIIYAFNGVAEREPLWGNLKRLAGQVQGPWAVGGDFNCVTQASERLRGNVTAAESEPFQVCLDMCNLMDIPASGAFYTWNNKQLPKSRIYSRIDRLLVNSDWPIHFPEHYANFLPEGLFDHTPCVVGMKSYGHNRNRPFKYFNMWSMAPGFQECVSTTWSRHISGTKMYTVVKRLQLLKLALKQLNQKHLSDIENRVDLFLTKLIQIQRQLVTKPGDEELIKQEHEICQHSKLLQSAKMNFLRQKAKAHWIKEGDINSSYFHGIMRARRNKNFIPQIRDHNDNLHTDEQGIQKGFLEYYTLLLGTKIPICGVKDFVVKRGKLCSDHHKSMLLSPITKEEIKAIIFHIPND
ncbi:hypothetical protein RND81_06G050600 [Saponaria officinalis]|uniref:Endonuclease/exonuclease/phosphatase domain-containing protein n=1 Tax=Saponaria officinalis TaxID=3572 RepID=A0AAW1K779_SAPOF